MVHSAGLLVYRGTTGGYEVLLTHPGGPFWARKDDWSIPKGEVDAGENLLQTLEREFVEEVGIRPPVDALLTLGEAPAHAGKTNHIWAAEADLDLAQWNCASMVDMEWPRGSGTMIRFPENDKAEWFTLDVAYRKIFKSQMVFLERLAEKLGASLPELAEPTNHTLF